MWTQTTEREWRRSDGIVITLWPHGIYQAVRDANNKFNTSSFSDAKAWAERLFPLARSKGSRR